ncbi:unnamed protein product [Gongylonema pulchrum]|uniref:Uncharacterized protein n=1 Tax=Gongylonema pulchrum TaxID=637853 RepID=A0A3P6PBT1_9BILA|nr:unnamed protein product [Gongylonema pulchrum]
MQGFLGCMIDEPLQFEDYCYQWIPLFKMNDNTSETFDSDLCEKRYSRRHSIAVESEKEWQWLMEQITNAMLEAKQANMTELYLILGGVMRNGNMEPTMRFEKNLKFVKIQNDNSPCSRYALVAESIEDTGYSIGMLKMKPIGLR